MKKWWLATAIVCLSVLWLSANVFAVGELLGLTVKMVVGEENQTYQGVVVEETVDTITLLLDSTEREIVIERDAIQSIRLMASQNVSRAPAANAAEPDPAFAGARRSAIQRVSTWRFFRDSIELSQTFLKLSYVQSQASQNSLGFGLWYLGLGLSTLAVDFFLRPSIEERLYWRSQLPFWHGIVGFVGDASNFGGDVSLGLATTQESVPLLPPELGSTTDWFERSYMLYSVQTVAIATHLVYDAITMLAPSPN